MRKTIFAELEAATTDHDMVTSGDEVYARFKNSMTPRKRRYVHKKKNVSDASIRISQTM